MKNYYIRYPRNFANEYDLVWIDAADTDSISRATEAGYERITRREAYAKVSGEKYRRKSDANFSGYAPTVILPYRVKLPELPDWDTWQLYFERHGADCGVLHCDSSTKRRDVRMFSGDRVVFEVRA